MLFEWLNSFEYHDDQTKKEQIEKLSQLLPFKANRAIFLMLLAEKIKAIISIANFIGLLLGKVKIFEINA